MNDEREAIRALIATWMEASKKGDTATVLSLMTDDVVFMVAGREPFGKAEFAAASAGQKDLRIEGDAEVKEVEVAGDWAWCRTFLRIAITPPDGKTMRRSGYTLTVLRKTNGKWQLARDANLLMPEN
jgi:uncharacterized protein (TIGR02246 family)